MSTETVFGKLRLLEQDHAPDGWPAVQMRDISALCDEIERRHDIDGELIAARRERDELRVLLAQPVASEPVAFDWPEYNDMAMGCGLEDRGITDRYEAMRYGWDEAAERYAEIAQAEPLFCKPPAPAVLEGYALVPIEPTPEMFVAAYKADDAAFCGGSSHGATAEDVWYAMIDAAQQPIIEG